MKEIAESVAARGHAGSKNFVTLGHPTRRTERPPGRTEENDAQLFPQETLRHRQQRAAMRGFGGPQAN
jgi:hypothetical protein